MAIVTVWQSYWPEYVSLTLCLYIRSCKVAECTLKMVTNYVMPFFDVCFSAHLLMLIVTTLLFYSDFPFVATFDKNVVC